MAMFEQHRVMVIQRDGKWLAVVGIRLDATTRHGDAGGAGRGGPCLSRSGRKPTPYSA